MGFAIFDGDTLKFGQFSAKFAKGSLQITFCYMVSTLLGPETYKKFKLKKLIVLLGEFLCYCLT